MQRRSVLFVGQAYYNHWYLSRELRKLGWTADQLNFDELGRGHYHGQDIELLGRNRRALVRHSAFYAQAVRKYDVFHFANRHGMRLSNAIGDFTAARGHEGDDVRWLKRMGKKIVYTANGCNDGLSRTALGVPHVCATCALYNQPDACSDASNRAWGALRNELADLVCMVGGYHGDANGAPNVREIPEVYCLDEQIWQPDLMIPTNYRLPYADSTFKVFHAVGGGESRSNNATLRNIKSTHIYLPLIDQLKAEGRDIEMLFFKDVPNLQLRYYQAQADVFVDMLEGGFFGATAREGMMLGKPVVCYLRPEWLEVMRREIPEYVDELPVISATPETVHDVLVDLMDNPDKRAEIGRRSREFAVRWHGAKAAARRFDELYSAL
jgi:hypothetical protein